MAKATEEVNDELECAKCKLHASGVELTPPAKRRQSQAADTARASTDAPALLPGAPQQTPAEVILSKAVADKSLSFPTAVTKEAMDKHLRSGGNHRQPTQLEHLRSPSTVARCNPPNFC